MKTLISALFTTLVLLAGCIHKAPQKTYLLEAPAIHLQQAFFLEDLKMPEYLCDTNMRYTTMDGTLEEVKDGTWAIPLDRLMRDVLRDSLANMPNASKYPLCTISIKQIRMTTESALEFTGHLSRNMHDNRARDPQTTFKITIPVELDKKNAITPENFRKAVAAALSQMLQTKLPVEAAL